MREPSDLNKKASNRCKHYALTIDDAASCRSDEAAASLKSGCPVIFPTDTVVGIGVSIEKPDSLEKLYATKGRDARKPIAWLIGNKSDLTRYGKNVPAYACSLADALWPGPLTLVVDASDEVAEAFRSDAGTIGLRMPDSETVLSLIRKTGAPIATTSANIAGENAPTSMAELSPEFAPEVMRLLDMSEIAGCADDMAHRASDAGAPVVPGTASTVVDCTGPEPLVLRTGTIPPSEIMETIRKAEKGGM